ncbi:MAG: hypothetical protein KF800_05900 [Lysobacter sp.]|nr:hypothetical protein [Lysobacter sp.]
MGSLRSGEGERGIEFGDFGRVSGREKVATGHGGRFQTHGCLALATV